jgi:hypothetical protein
MGKSKGSNEADPGTRPHYSSVIQVSFFDGRAHTPPPPPLLLLLFLLRPPPPPRCMPLYPYSALRAHKQQRIQTSATTNQHIKNPQ